VTAAAPSAWHDLSHRLDGDAPRLPAFPAPVLRQLMCRPADPMQVSALELCCHVGTHVDAPVHFLEGAPAIDDLPPERFAGAGVVLRVEAAAEDVIGADALAAAAPGVRAGDIVLLDTGWSALWRDERYVRHPSLGLDAADWLVERGAKLLGVDFPTPDRPLCRRPEGFDWPVHRRLLGAGVLVAEHLTGLRALAGRRVEVVCAPLNLAGADGAPARVLARPLPDPEAAP